MSELTAALATIEKCREITGCPAGVDLQDWVKQLAVENVGLNAAAEFATAPDMWIEQADGMLDYRYCDWYVDVLKAAMETPATDRIVAGIKADGVEEFIRRLQQHVDEGDFIGDEVAVIVGAIDCGKEFCEQLLEGAK
ncbi:hypothetical protein [Raoultella ornithinolytica]|uniref:hypothetical protein n=1 Tax=Raoultella ornithinolytica TaxID=54291 RepID=UPI000CF3169D|nr:hypothetical protein C5T92_22400 [Raoultella ornithinolytica]PQH34843.1 hypothetical protein C5T94_24115 [Raoultella ornithinolytica]